MLIKFADDTKLEGPVNTFEGRASAQGPRQAGGMGQHVPYENQQIPSPASGMGGPLGTAEVGTNMGTSSVGKALGGP